MWPHNGLLYFVIIEKIGNRALLASLSLSLIQCKLMIEYDRYAWLKSDQVTFGINWKFLYLTRHVLILSHLYNHRRNRALLSFTLMILYAPPPFGHTKDRPLLWYCVLFFEEQEKGCLILRTGPCPLQ